MAAKAEESAARNLIPEPDYPRTGYYFRSEVMVSPEINLLGRGKWN
jgi:hypothetical protein